MIFTDDAKRLVDIGMKNKKSQWLVSSDKLLKDREKRVIGAEN